MSVICAHVARQLRRLPAGCKAGELRASNRDRARRPLAQSRADSTTRDRWRAPPLAWTTASRSWRLCSLSTFLVDSLATVSRGDRTEVMSWSHSLGKAEFSQETDESVCGYQVVRVIAQGGQASVYEVRDSCEQPWALKVYKAPLPGEGQHQRRFARESKEVAARLGPAAKRANLVVGEEYGQWRERSFIKMRLMKGETLADRLRREGQMAVSDALGFSIDIAEALAAAHREGVLHRDLKPDNVFIDNFGRGHVLDWGSMKLLDPACTRTAERYGTFCSVGYVPVEQYTEHRSRSTLTPAADLYALGVLLYEALAGYHPFLSWRRGPATPSGPVGPTTQRRRLERDEGMFRNAPTPHRDDPHAKPWLRAQGRATLRSRPPLPEVYELQTCVRPRRLPNVSRGVNNLLRSLLDSDAAARPQSGTDVSVRLRAELTRLNPKRPVFVRASANANVQHVRDSLKWHRWWKRIGAV